MPILLLLLVLLGGLAARPAHAATYYASPSGGGSTCSEGNPCSLAGGLGRMASGDTLLLKGGTYTTYLSYVQGLAVPSGGGSWATASVLASAPNETAILRPTGNSNVVQIDNNANWIIFDRLVLDGSGMPDSPFNDIVFMNPGPNLHHLRWNQVELKNSPHHGFAASGAFMEFIDCYIHDLQTYGWYFTGHDSLFRGNTIVNTGGSAFHIYDSGQTTLSNNVVEGNRISNVGHASRDYEGNYRGIHALIMTSGSNNIAKNNLVYGSWGGIQVGDTCLNCKVYNNTVYGSTDGSGIQLSSGNGGDNMEVINNISYANPHLNVEDWHPPGLVFHHNLTDGTDPKFENAAAGVFNLLPGSPAIDAGVPVPGVTNDFDKKARPMPAGGAYDIGALEFVQGGGGTPPDPTPPGSGNVYYSSPTSSSTSPCSEASPCSLAGGIARLASGDKLLLRQGTYTTRISYVIGTWPPSGGGSWATATIIASYPGETATIRPSDSSPLEMAADASWMIFERLVFDGGALPFEGDRVAMFLNNGPSHIRFSQVEMMNSPLHGANGAVTDLQFLDSYIHDIATYGFYFSGNNSIFKNNIFRNIGGYAFHIFDSNSTIVSNNLVDGNSIYNAGYHSWNFSVGYYTQYSAMVLASGSNNVAQNNIIYGSFGGIDITDSCKNCKVYNNTIYGSTDNAGLVLFPQADNVEAINNILYNNTAGDFSDYNPPGKVVHDNLIGTNPQFENASAGNFHLLATSPARNQGFPLPTVPTDFDKKARPQGIAYDQGALEFVEGGGGGTTPATGNPIYVRGVVGDDSNSCVAAEAPTTAKKTWAGGLACLTVPGKVMYVEGNGAVYVEEWQTLRQPITGGVGPSMSTNTRIEGYGTTPPVLQSPPGGSVTLWLNSDVSYVTITNVVVDGANRTSNVVALTASAHHIVLDRLEIKGTTTGQFEGLYVDGADQIEVTRVFIHHVQSDALALVADVDGFLCQQCHLVSAGGAGLSISASGTKTNITIRETEIRNNSGAGIDMNAGTGALLQNLLVHSNGGRGVWVHTGVSGTRVYNSTIYGNTGAGLQCDTGASSSDFRNNIVYGNTGGNIVNNCGATVAKNLCAATSAACALGGDPLFVAAPTNLHLGNGSPGINTGDAIPSILTDYGGQPRRQGAQDVGAWERNEGGAPAPTPLRVSTTNPRYFENQSGDIVYLTGAYSWNFASTMPDAEVTDYLNYVVANNHNYIRVPSQDYDGSAQSTNYFTILASRVTQAADLGIYVGVNILPLTTSAPFDNLAFNEAYTRDLVRAVGNAPNVLYEVGNELETQALDGGTVGFFANRIVDVINDEQQVQCFTPRRMVSISDFRATGSSYAANPAVVSFLLGSHADFVQIGFSQSNTGVCTILPDYAGQKVSMPDSDHILPYHCGYPWVWQMLMRGGNPTLLEGNAFFPDHTEPDNPSDTTGATLTYEARIRMGDTRTYATKLHLGQAVPHPELTSTGYALVWPGEEYLVYQPAAGSFTVNLLAGQYAVEWFDPTARTTMTAAPLTVASAGAQTFTTPMTPPQDAVLFLKATPVVPQGPAVTVREQNLGQAGWYF